jgi:hypothetical protein
MITIDRAFHRLRLGSKGKWKSWSTFRAALEFARSDADGT